VSFVLCLEVPRFRLALDTIADEPVGTLVPLIRDPVAATVQDLPPVSSSNDVVRLVQEVLTASEVAELDDDADVLTASEVAELDDDDDDVELDAGNVGYLGSVRKCDSRYLRPVRRPARRKLVLMESEAAELDDDGLGSMMILVDERRGPVRRSARIACRK